MPSSPCKRTIDKPIIVNFVRRQTKLALMKKKSSLQHQSGRPIYINDDIIQLGARLLKSLKEKPDVKAANMKELQHQKSRTSEVLKGAILQWKFVFETVAVLDTVYKISFKDRSSLVEYSTLADKHGSMSEDL